MGTTGEPRSADRAAGHHDQRAEPPSVPAAEGQPPADDELLALHAASDRTALLEAALGLFARLPGVESASLATGRPDSQELETVAWRGGARPAARWPDPEGLRGRRPAAGPGAPPTCPAHPRSGTHRQMLFPLDSDGSTRLVLVACGPGRPWPPGVPERAATIAHHVEVAHRRLAGERLLRTRVDELSALARLDDAATHASGMEQLLASVIDQVKALLNAERGGVMLYDPKTEELALQKPAFGVSDELVKEYRVSKATGGNAMTVFLTGRPFMTDLARGNPDVIQRFVRIFKVRSVLTVPLDVGSHRIGVLHVANKQDGAFTEHDRDLLMLLSSHLAALIEKEHLLRRLERRQEEAQVLYRIGLEIHGSLEPQRVLRSVAEHARRLVSADAAAILIAAAAGEAHEILATSGECLASLGGPVPGRSPVLDRILSGEEPYLVTALADLRLEGDSPLAAALAPLSPGVCLLVPLAPAAHQAEPGESAGALLVFRHGDERFDADAVDLVARLASLAALAVKNARLYSQEQTVASELREASGKIRAQHESLAHAARVNATLTEAVLEGTGLSGICLRLKDLVGNPVVVIDSFGRVLYREPAAGADPLADEAYREAARSAEGGARPQRTRVGGPGGELHLWTAPIIVKRQPLGTLVVVERERPLGEIDTLALEQGATVLALELLRSRSEFEVEIRLKGDLLQALLGEDVAKEGLLQRAGLLGHDLGRPQGLLLVSAHAAGAAAGASDQAPLYALLRSLAAYVAARLPGTLVAQREGLGVLLVPTTAGAEAELLGIARQVRSHLAESWPTLAVSVVNGGVCPDPSEIRATYDRARRCLAALRGLGWRDGVVSADALGALGLMISTEAQARQVLDFARRLLAPLETYDRDYPRAHLLETLTTYVANQHNLARTAAALGIHPSTLRYRLRRIGEITSLDLEAPDARFDVEFAVRALRAFQTLGS